MIHAHAAAERSTKSATYDKMQPLGRVYCGPKLLHHCSLALLGWYRIPPSRHDLGAAHVHVALS